MKNKKYLVGEGTIFRYSPETGREFKGKTIPTDIDEVRRGYGCTENTNVSNMSKTDKKKEKQQ